MTPLQAKELKALAKSHSVPNDDKLRRRIDNLERMLKFYEAKALEVPESRFTTFTVTLTYAITVIKMYRKLTTRLAEIAAQESENE